VNEEIHTGRREGSVSATQGGDGEERDERKVWARIRMREKRKRERERERARIQNCEAKFLDLQPFIF